jgi:hypothetical protein
VSLHGCMGIPVAHTGEEELVKLSPVMCKLGLAHGRREALMSVPIGEPDESDCPA